MRGWLARDLAALALAGAVAIACGGAAQDDATDVADAADYRDAAPEEPSDADGGDSVDTGWCDGEAVRAQLTPVVRGSSSCLSVCVRRIGADPVLVNPGVVNECWPGSPELAALLDHIRTAVERESIGCSFLECIYGPDRDDYLRLAEVAASCRDLEGLAATFDVEGRVVGVAAGPDPICDPPTEAQLECIRLAVSGLSFPCLAGRSLCFNPWTCE
jgi:hypothetical protein